MWCQSVGCRSLQYTLGVSKPRGFIGLQHDEAMGASTTWVATLEQNVALPRTNDGKRPDPETLSRNLWGQYWEDPAQWDSRLNKETLEGSDIMQPKTGEGVGIDTRFKLDLVQAKHHPLQDTKAGPDRVSVERLWESYFRDRTEWWDNRNRKLHPKSPDFRHRITKQGLRIDNWDTPQWVIEVLQKETSSRKAGGGRYGSGTGLSGAGRSGNNADCLEPEHDEFYWTARISQSIKAGQARHALNIYEEMQVAEVEPSSYTYVAALKACSILQDLESAKHIHAEVVKHGFESDVYVGTMLVDVYGKCGSLVNARSVFEDMPYRNVVSWNAIILVYAQMEEGLEALQLYSRMQQEGILCNDRTFVSVLKACSSLAALEEGREADGVTVKSQCLERVRTIHSHVLETGFESDVFVGTMLVDVYNKCRSVGEARHVFEKMPHRNVVSWTAMILGYAQVEEGDLALQMYRRMQQEGVVPNNRTFVGALKACSSLAETKDVDGDVELPVQKRCLEQVRAIHSEVAKAGFETDLFVATMLVDVYAKCGSLSEARGVFDKMQCRDVASWNAMILAYAQTEQAEEALQLYTRMQLESVIPNHRTFVAALKACGVVAGLEKGKEIHGQIANLGPEGNGLFVPTSLIDMYGKCASMVDAQRVFDVLPTRDIVTWSALIAGYARQGECDVVFDLFDRMLQDGVQPNSITFLSVLTACSHGCLVEKGQDYFQAMSRDYGIAPTIEHYNCMVDLLGRAGQLDKAMAMVETMPVRPDVALWRTVLGACRKWRNVELGRQAFEHAVRLDKADAAVYVLMANIYSGARMWDCAKEIQATRVKTGVWKQPGQSWWTDMGGVVHTFVVGDREHPESQDIHAKVGDLVLEMKAAGYVPHLDSVLRDIPDHEKEDALCGHSEKLAIVYALMKTPPGTTIRVVKNLRVCEDCHTATALISKIEQRTIICRDASRFHVYKDGKCSCGDYW